MGWGGGDRNRGYDAGYGGGGYGGGGRAFGASRGAGGYDPDMGRDWNRGGMQGGGWNRGGYADEGSWGDRYGGVRDRYGNRLGQGGGMYGRGGAYRGYGETGWTGGYDRDFGDRVREGWNDLTRGVRRAFRGGNDRGW
ncbi:MAG: hypothetical protein AB1941_08415 [Gemmatimonadota bacterium]